MTTLRQHIKPSITLSPQRAKGASFNLGPVLGIFSRRKKVDHEITRIVDAATSTEKSMDKGDVLQTLLGIIGGDGKFDLATILKIVGCIDEVMELIGIIHRLYENNKEEISKAAAIINELVDTFEE